MRILFVQTGGTIDKDYPRTMNGWAFEIGDEPAVERILTKLNPSSGLQYKVVSAMKKDSLEITDDDRKQLVECILANEKKEDDDDHYYYDKIIITHGTDTIADTARYLASNLPADSSNKKKKRRTIVLTGSMRPERFSNSDADLNLGMAIASVQILSNKEGGIFICMHGLVIPYDKIKRNMDTGQYYINDDENKDDI